MKPIKLLLTLCALTMSILTISAHATSYTWAQTLGVGSYDPSGAQNDDPFYGSGTDYPVALAKMPDGGVVVAGQLDLPKRYFQTYVGHTASAADATLVRYAPDGTIAWQRVLHQTNDRFDGTYYTAAPSRVYQIRTDADGNIFVLGGKGNPDNGAQVPFVAKFAADGTLAWQNVITGAFANKSDWSDPVECGVPPSYYMCLTNDGGVAINGGQTRPNQPYTVPTLVKFNANGQVVLYRAYEHPAQYASSLPLAQSNDGSKFIMVAPYSTPNAGGLTMVLVDGQTGGLVRQKQFEPVIQGEAPRAVIAMADGTFAILSHYGDHNGVVVRKVSGDLTSETFEKIIQRSGFSGSSLTETADGGLLIGGNTGAPGGATGGGGYEAALLKVKADGTLEFASLLGGPDTENYDDGITIGASALPMTGGGYAFTIATRSYGASLASHKPDWWIVRMDSNRHVTNFGGLMMDENASDYTITDETRTPADVTYLSPVDYTVSAITSSQPTFNLEDSNGYTAPDKPTVTFQAAAAPIGASCPTGQTDCGGICVDLQTDSQNCGTCGNSCPSGYTCSSGGCVKLPEAKMSIFATQTSTSDPVNGLFTHIGDDLVYTITFANNGDAMAKNLRVVANVPTYIENQTNLTKQFVASDISMSPGSTFVPESSPGAKDAHIVWDVGDLDVTLQQFVRFTVHIANNVRIQQQIALPNDYLIYSTTNQPGQSITGYESGADNVETQVEGPISLALKTNNTNVAPGAQFSYVLTIKNLGSTTATHAVAMLTQPEFARFISATFGSPTPAPKKKPKKPFKPTAKLVYVQGQSDPQIVMDAGPLNAGQSIAITLTFQAQWVDPSEAPKLSTIDYAASFLTEAAYTNFLSSFNSATSDPYSPVTTNFLAFISTNSNNVAFAHNDSGIVDLPLQGSMANAPQLGLAKTVSATVNRVNIDEDHVLNTVKPGAQVSFLLLATNNGNTEAPDVYVQDRMPDHSTFVSAVQLYPTPTPAKPKKKKPAPSPTPIALQPKLDADGHHLRFTGLNLPAHSSVVVNYTVQVDSGGAAPATGTLIGADDPNSTVSVSSMGTSVSPHTPAGIYGGGAIMVVADAKLAQPIVRTLVPSPAVSNDVNATVNTYNSLIAANANALPLTNPSDFTSWIPGVERYYVHYQNLSTVAVNNAHLTVALPSHTQFYRASFVSLPATNATGQLGAVNATLITPPAGSTITPPAFLASDDVVGFNFTQLAAGAQGDVMVEVIVTEDAIQNDGSFVGGESNRFATMSGDFADDAKALLPRIPVTGSKPSSTTAARVANSSDTVPNIGVQMFLSSNKVANGHDMSVIVALYNYGDTTVTSPSMTFVIPSGMQHVGHANSIPNPGPNDLFVDGSNGPTHDVEQLVDHLEPHTAALLRVDLRATASAGSDISIPGAVAQSPFAKALSTEPWTVSVVASPALVQPMLLATFAGSRPAIHYLANGGDVLMIDIGGGNIVAAGAGNLVAQGAGNIISTDGASLVAQGAGNLINVSGVSAASLVAQGAGNLVAQGAGNLIGSGGSTLVAQGAGNIFAAGGGSLVAQGAGNLVAQGAGNLVAQGAGNLVAQGAGNLVAQGAGNIVAAGAGNVVAANGTMLASLPNSAALVQGKSMIVAAGAGNLVAQGAGN
jgi:uncharacterized repeat protein (TIGR01451 family)